MALAEPYRIGLQTCCIMSLAEDFRDPDREPPHESNVIICHYGHTPSHQMIWRQDSHGNYAWEALWPQELPNENPDDVLPGPVTCQQCHRTYMLSAADDYYTRHSDGMKVCGPCLTAVPPVTPVQPQLKGFVLAGPDPT